MSAPSSQSAGSLATATPASTVPAQREGLAVERSALGKKWVFTPYDARLAAGISQSHGLPELLGRLLSARGIDCGDVPAFLEPTLKGSLPDPSLLKDMDIAARRIADAVAGGQKVAVFGDYDVDGATSSALLRKYFRALGQDVRLYIPDRIAEGYGPNAQAMRMLRAEKCDLVITVDCGATAFEALDAAQGEGLDVVVLDHHRCEPQLPHAVAVVNPNRLDDDSGQGHMAACGIVFLTLVAVNRELRARGYFSATRPEPHILQWLDLVALGTVCDVVPLTGVNRAYVAQGLRVMAMRQNAGVVALCDVAGVDSLLSVPALSLHLSAQLERLGPYGAGHAEPRFVLPQVKVIKPKVVGDSHVSFFIQDSAGGGSVKAIAFRALDTALGELLLKHNALPVHLAGHVTINEWLGKKTVQFQVVDGVAVCG